MESTPSPTNETNSGLPARPSSPPPRPPLVPEASDFLDGDAPAADKVAAFLAHALEATGGHAPAIAAALVPWICDALLSNHSVKAYGRDLTDFFRHMQAQGVTPLEVTADHVKLYKRALARRRPDLGHRGPAALGPPRRLRAARRQGARFLGDRPGHRRRQGRRRAEELHPVPRPSGRRSPCWRRSPPTRCKESATWR